MNIEYVLFKHNCNLKKHSPDDYKFLSCTFNCKFINYLFLNIDYQVSFSNSFYYKSEICKKIIFNEIDLFINKKNQ